MNAAVAPGVASVRGGRLAVAVLAGAFAAVPALPGAGRALAPPVATAGGTPRDTVPSGAPGSGAPLLDGFHRFTWGTRPEEIPELDATAAPERMWRDLAVRSTPLRLLGMRARAFFYFDAGAGLRKGRLWAEPEGASCVGLYRTLTLMMSARNPRLEVRREEGTGRGAQTHRAACRRLLRADTVVPWRTEYRHPTTGAVEARAVLFRREGRARILACWHLEGDCAWPEGEDLDWHAELRGVGRGPPRDTTGGAGRRSEGAPCRAPGGGAAGTRACRGNRAARKM